MSRIETSDPDSPNVPPDSMASRIARLLAYGGPVGITLDNPKIEPRLFRAPYRNLPHKELAHVRSFHLHTHIVGSEVHLHIDDPLANQNAYIPPEEIESSVKNVWIDHPLHQFLPLHNAVMMRVGAARQFDGQTVIRWADRAMEFDNLQRIERTIPEHSHIAVVNAYDISRTRGQMTLEQAKRARQDAARFLISHVGLSTVLITTRLGSNHDDNQPLTVRPPRYAHHTPLLHIEAVDVPLRRDDDAMLDFHLQRIHNWHPHPDRPPDMPISLFEADVAFAYMVHD